VAGPLEGSNDCGIIAAAPLDTRGAVVYEHTRGRGWRARKIHASVKMHTFLKKGPAPNGDPRYFRSSAFPHEDGIGDLRAGDGSSRDFAGVVTRLLDEFDAADFRSGANSRHHATSGAHGFRISTDSTRRLRTCHKAIRVVFEANRPALMTGDSLIVERFEQILEAFSRTDVRHYSRELTQVRALQAEARLLLQGPDGVRALIGDYADRIHGDCEAPEACPRPARR
jgi:hypothetical protein